MSTTPLTVKFAGDEHPETIRSKDQIILVRDGLTIANGNDDYLTPETLGLVTAALALIPSEIKYETILDGPATTAAVEALIAAEADLHSEDDADNPDMLLKEVQAPVQRALRATGRRLLEQGSRRAWVPYDIFFVMYDETDEYSDDGHLSNLSTTDAAKYIASIEAVYYFDLSTHIHLCEITPSLALHYFESRAIRKDEYEDDSEAESVRDDVEQEVLPTYEEVTYLHVSEVEAYLKANAKGTVYHWGNPGLDLDELRDEVLDKLGRGMNEARKRKGQPPLSDVEIEKAWEKDLDEQIGMLVMEKVREAVQGNPVL